MSEPGIKQPKPPAMTEGAFNCPHCGAHTQQQWWSIFATTCKTDRAFIPTEDQFIAALREMDEDRRTSMIAYKDAALAPDPRPYRENSSTYTDRAVPNTFLTTCFVCSQGALWLAGKLIWPAVNLEVTPNPDLPPHVKRDFEEASAIAFASPRGAAALLRLAIEKLCLHLGEEGSVDAMIGKLVAKGLSVKIQQALDVVRVVGNKAVHPGTLDFDDSPATVQTLFRMVNLIAEKMITEERHVAEAFATLSPEQQKWIEDRNRGAIKKAASTADQ